MSIVFEAGVQLRCFDIATTPDGVSELLVERFRVSITSTTAFGVIIITQPSTVVSIVDNDGELSPSESRVNCLVVREPL